jgi:CRISPR-associated endoribonuclease Cas6
MFSLKLTKLKARLYFPRYSLPYWLGNKFRGGFGNVLFRAICSYTSPRCHACASNDECLYYVIYEKERQKLGKSQPPRPIIFVPPFFGRKESGRGELEIEINILGNYYTYLPHVIYGLRFLGKIGLNYESKYEVASIHDAFSRKEVYDGFRVDSEALKPIDLGKIEPVELKEFRVEFKTPLEARSPLEAECLLKMIRRRLMLFVNEYGEGKVPDFSIETETIEESWKKHELLHSSKRGGTRKFYGITGYAKYRVKQADENAMKLLKIGELIGAGSKASFGFGFFKISSPNG